MTYFLGLDIGTSSVKAVILDEHDKERASASAALAVDRPRPLWSEQDPEAWWRATEAVLDRLAREQPALMSDIVAIGLSGQMLGVTLLDATDRPLRPALIWNDGRAVQECALLLEKVPGFVDIVGCRPMAGFCAPKILWLAGHEPDAMAKTRRILLAKDYVRLRLCGEAISDLADSSATLLMDTRAGTWSEAAIAACGISRDVLPHLVESGAEAGILRGELSRRWNMQPGVIVAGGAGDNMCGAVGAEVVNRGDAYISLGTSGVYFVANDQFVPARGHGMHTHRHAVLDLFAQHGCVLSAAAALSWLADLLRIESIEQFLSDIEAADIESEQIPIFTPYLSGERTPHDNPSATAAFSNLGLAAGPLHLGRAVLEGVAFAIADCHDALLGDGAPIDDIALIGGGARSRFWAEIIASTIGRPLRIPPLAALGPAVGAARLARKAKGGCLVAVAADGGARIVPRADLAEGLRQRRARYREHYPLLSCEKPAPPASVHL
jgi:xylulokinase